MATITHYEIETARPTETMRFYGELCGWTFEPMMDGYWLIRSGREGTVSGAVMASEEEKTRTIAVFAVDDIDAFVAAAKAQGGTIASEIMDVPDVGRFVYCDDPNGLRFGAVQELKK
ncbi:VOC family protein [Paenibacillus sp. TRM 82003]|nr:VOC family protein [Paenibacillus sp. TRM 82003]